MLGDGRKHLAGGKQFKKSYPQGGPQDFTTRAGSHVINV